MDFHHLRTDTAFDLDLTLSSGQFFRWKPYKSGYLIQDAQKCFIIWQRNSDLEYTSVCGKVSSQYLTDFFRLDDDLEQIFSRWNDSSVRKAFSRYKGLRLIRQDPWECALSFLCSMASNIPRITQNINTLATRFGASTQTPYGSFSRLPTPEQLAEVSLEDLYNAGVGFRAKYLYGLAKSGLHLESLRDEDYKTAKATLLSIKGIGDKVADCILLFSLDHLEAFPVDTWIMKALQTWIFPDLSGSPAQFAEQARKHFGAFAGYAQQYLFHHARAIL